MDREMGGSQQVRTRPKEVSSAESLDTFLTHVWAAYEQRRHTGSRSLDDFVYDMYKQPEVVLGYTTSTEDYRTERDTVREWHQANGGRLTEAGGYPALATNSPKDRQTSLFRIVVRPKPDTAGELFNFWGKQVLNHPNVRSAKVAGDPDDAALMGDPIVVYLVAGGAAATRDQVAEVTKALINNYVEGLRTAGRLGNLVPGLPPMVEEVVPGIGWAEQPPPALANGRSFGEYRAAVIAAALGRAKSMQEFYSAVLDEFSRARLDIRSPHLNTG